MKLLVVLMVGVLLSACGEAKNPTIEAAEAALVNLKEGREVLASINTVEDAKAAEAKLAEAGKSYKAALQLMKQNNDAEVAQKLMTITPKVASEYQGLILALNELQRKNVDAANVILDEVRSFKTD